MEPGTLTQVLNGFLAVFTLGMARVTPEARALLVAVATIELVLLGLWICMGHLDGLSMTLVTMAIKTTFYLLLVTNWGMIVKVLVTGFVRAGLAVGGSVIREPEFTDPSALAGWGIGAMSLVYNRIFSYSGLSALYNLPDILLTGIAASLATVAFGVFAIQVFVTILEFYALASVIVILIPFGMIRVMAFLAEKALAMLWAYALKLLILSTITGIALPLLFKVNPGNDARFEQIVPLAITAWALVVLAWRAPQIAQALLHGAPALTADTVTHAVRSSMTSIQTAVNTMRGVAGTPPAPETVPVRRRP